MSIHKKIFVTGGLGFIGSHIVESLVSQGASVTIYDNYSTGSEENIASVIKDVQIIKGDILDSKLLTKSMKGHELVSHQAAQLEITRAISDPIEDLTTNTIGTLHLYNACLKNNINRLIQATSAGVYGQAISTPQEEDLHPTNPNWAYGVSKLANEKYASIYQEMYDLKITNLRYAIVYGPREWYGRVLTLFLKRALEKKPLIIFGSGEQIRDFVFVKDVVEVHNRCIIDDNASNQTFNVSTGIGTTINQLADQIVSISGKNSDILHEDVPEGKASTHFDRIRLPMELKTLIQSTKKLEQKLAYKPTTSLQAGLKEEWTWLKENPHRWQKMSY